MKNKAMKKLILFSGSILTAAALQAQTPNWAWATQPQGNGNSYSQCIAADNAGNSYVMGEFCDTLYIGNQMLPSNTCGNVFLAKLDPAGNFIWAQWLFMGDAFAIATDPAGDVIIAGRIQATTVLGNSSFYVKGASDIIIAKFGPNGNVVWAEQAGSSGGHFENGNGLSIDAAGDIYLSGTFCDSAWFGNSLLVGKGLTDAFVAKYSSAGNVLWVRGGGGAGFDSGSDVAVDGSGNCFVTGFIKDTAWFGNQMLTINQNWMYKCYNLFLAKYDNMGNLLWVKQGTGNSDIWGTGVATDASGNCCVSGYFTGSCTFGNTSLTAAGQQYRDILVLKYDGSGNVLWANKAGSTYTDMAEEVISDNAGNFYVTGNYMSNVFFGNISVGGIGGWDLFVAKYNSSGNPVWVQTAGGGLNSTTGYNAIAMNASGDIFLAGYFNYNFTMGNTSLLAGQKGHSYFAKLSSTTGVEETPYEGSLTIYPNPSSGEVFIRSHSEKIRRIELVNSLGQVCFNMPLQGVHPVELEHPAPGIYFILAYDAEGKRLGTEKLIIK